MRAGDPFLEGRPALGENGVLRLVAEEIGELVARDRRADEGGEKRVDIQVGVALRVSRHGGTHAGHEKQRVAGQEKADEQAGFREDDQRDERYAALANQFLQVPAVVQVLDEIEDGMHVWSRGGETVNVTKSAGSRKRQIGDGVILSGEPKARSRRIRHSSSSGMATRMRAAAYLSLTRNGRKARDGDVGAVIRVRRRGSPCLILRQRPLLRRGLAQDDAAPSLGAAA
jgi:hypothetical protein